MNLKRLFFLLSLGTMILCSGESRVSADVIVEFLDAEIVAGGRGYVDLLISSNSSDTLFLASFKLQITPVSSVVSQLYFRDSFIEADPTNPLYQMNSEQADAEYVFAASVPDTTNFTAIRDLTDPTIFIGSDTTSTGVSATLSGTKKLLARVELESVTLHPEAAIGESFLISLVNDGATYFCDDQMNDLPISTSSFSNYGTIRVAAPEPSTFALLAVGLALVAGFRRWQSAGPVIAGAACGSVGKLVRRR
jgi:hypothetical protein